MGAIIFAECICGFRSKDFFVGGGIMDFGMKCNMPAICISCGFLFERNITSKKYIKCPKCRKKALIYGDVSLQGEKIRDNPLFSWHIRDDVKISLPHTYYYIPNCKQKRMQFTNIGLWD
jgi:DNA-directed RNA polymerase subunit RPC12/RpoP